MWKLCTRCKLCVDIQGHLSFLSLIIPLLLMWYSTDVGCGLTFSETLRALSISSFLVNESLGLHCKAPALVTRPVQLKPSSPTCFLMFEPIWEANKDRNLISINISSKNEKASAGMAVRWDAELDLLHYSLQWQLHIWPHLLGFQTHWSARWPVLQGHLGWC